MFSVLGPVDLHLPDAFLSILCIILQRSTTFLKLIFMSVASESDVYCAVLDSKIYMQVRLWQAIIPSKGSWDCYIEQTEKPQQGKSLHPWKWAAIGMAWHGIRVA